jgi:hypothetical protein
MRTFAIIALEPIARRQEPAGDEVDAVAAGTMGKWEGAKA